MIGNLQFFKNTKAELFIKKVRTRKIIISKLKKLKRPICYMPFRNSKILCLFFNKSRF